MTNGNYGSGVLKTSDGLYRYYPNPDIYPQQNASFQDSSLLGWWPLNEGAPSVKAFDASGNGNDGIWNGAASGKNGFYSPGNKGATGSFNGSDNSVVTPSSAVTPVALTMLAWVRMNSNLGDLVYSSNSTFGLAVFPGGALEASIVNSSNRSQSSAAIVPTNNTSWVLVGLQYSNAGGSLNLVFNGQLVTAYSTHYISGGTLPSIGAIHMAGPTFIEGVSKCQLSNVQIYNRILSSAELQRAYNTSR